MIKSFADKRTAGLMGDRRHRSLPPEIAMRAKDKLAMLDPALMPPPDRAYWPRWSPAQRAHYVEFESPNP